MYSNISISYKVLNGDYIVVQFWSQFLELVSSSISFKMCICIYVRTYIIKTTISTKFYSSYNRKIFNNLFIMNVFYFISNEFVKMAYHNKKTTNSLIYNII